MRCTRERKLIHNTSKLSDPLQEVKTFTLFPELPPELRLKIWKHALSEPRISMIEQTMPPHRNRFIFKFCLAPPTFLHVNDESRSLAQKAYQLAFEGGLEAPQFFNFQFDSLHLQLRTHVPDWSENLEAFQKDFAKVQDLVIYGGFFIFPISRLKKNLVLFKELKTLIIHYGANENQHGSIRSKLKKMWDTIRKEVEASGGPIFQKPVVRLLTWKDIKQAENLGS